MMFQNLSENGNMAPPPIALPHLSFVTNLKVGECSVIHEIPSEMKCDFVRNTPSCTENVVFINYMKFLFCSVNSTNKFQFISAIFLLALICWVLFIILGNTADRFFCPALSVLSDTMGLSENIAGVTLLAFGNGSPDIFTALADYDGDTELMYAELMGAAIFIIGVVSATIIVIRPFTINANSFIRDILFFVVACAWIAISLRNREVNYLEANGAIVIYLIYLAVVIIQHVIAKKRIKEQPAQNEKLDKSSINDQQENIIYDLQNENNNKLFSQFLNDINPIDDWNEIGFIRKIYSLLKSPIVLALIIIIPCVDHTVEPLHGWSKLLNTIQIIAMPIILICLKKFHTKTLAGLNIIFWCLPILLLLAMIVFFTSNTMKKPKYHLLYAIFGSFVGSIITISVVASELVSILVTFGVVSGWSHSILGLSVLAWGNSVGDLISNIALAKKGYSKMGFAACFGGPLFNTLLGIGIVFNLKILKNGGKPVHAREGAMGPNCSYFLFFLLIFALLIFAITGFQARRSVGIFLISIYGWFILYCALGEAEIIHPYGTDHLNEGEK